MVRYIMAMATTIQVSNELLDKLKTMKMYDKESYEEIIWDLLEDRMELSEQTKKTIEKSLADFKAGRTVSFEEVKRKMKLVRN